MHKRTAELFGSSSLFQKSLVIVFIDLIGICVHNIVWLDDFTVPFADNICNIEVECCKTDHYKSDYQSDNLSTVERIENKENRGKNIKGVYEIKND